MVLTVLCAVFALQFYPWGILSFFGAFFLLKDKRWIALIGILITLLGYSSIYQSLKMDGTTFNAVVLIDSDGKGYYGRLPVCSSKIGLQSGSFEMKWEKYHCAVPVKTKTVSTPLFSLRSFMEKRLNNLKSAPLLNALVLGEKLPVRIQEQAIKTGILHVFAISGLQTTLLLGYIQRFGKNKMLTLLAGMVLVFFYGFAASVLRSVLMYGVMLAIPKGRKLGLGGVAAAALLASFLDPLFLTRISSILSVVGAAAVVYWGDSSWSGVKISLSLLPVSLVFFHSFSLISVVSNVLMVPIFTLLYGLGVLYVAAPLRLIGFATDGIGSLLLALHQWVEVLPSWFVLNFSSLEVFIILVAVVLTFTLKKWWIPILASIVFVLVPAQNRVVFLDVGQGSATLVQKGSYGLLVDVSKNDVVLRDVRWYGIRHLAVIISHDDNDHNGMLEQVQLSFHPTVFTTFEGDTVSFGPITAETLWPPKNFVGTDNEQSKVIYLPEWNGLITGDVPQAYLPAGDYDFFTVPHHGAKMTSLNLTSSVGVISVGKNSYGHPNAQTLNLLESKGITVYRTDVCGDIVLERGQFSCNP